MNRHGTPKRPYGILVFGLLALLAGVLLWLTFAAAPRPVKTTAIPTQKATLLPQLKGLQPFSLLDHRGRAFDNARLRGQWTFLNFGYTHCPDVCPTTLALLTELDHRLQTMTPSIPYQVAFVSIDPARDSPARLAEYVNYFDPEFLGVTGSEEKLQRLTQPLGILYRKVDTDSAMDYVMDHSASIILVDPKGRYHAVFSPPHDAQMMAEDFVTITRHYGE